MIDPTIYASMHSSSLRRYVPSLYSSSSALTLWAGVICVLLVHTLSAQAQVGTINGFVRDTDTKETLISATVSIKGTKFGALTNKSGFFVLKNVPAGAYTLSVRYLGYQPVDKQITIEADAVQSLDIAMTSKTAQSEQVTVEANREVEKRQISISQVNVSMQTIKQMRLGGEADVFRTIQLLPGVLTSSQISSGLFIRGGSPDQNLVLLDGMTVYNPSHLFGFISTFNADAIKDVELIKGGFPAEYGGRLSAVLNLTQKDGNRDKFEGVGSVGLISSKLSLEGPVGNGSWFIGGRRTYLDLILGLVPEDPQNPFPRFGFYDLNGKITQNISPNDKISLSGFMSADDLTLNGAGVRFTIGIGNRGASLKWTHVFGEDLFSTVNITASRYRNGFNGNNAGFKFLVQNFITDYSVKANFEWFTTNELTLKFGAEYTNYRFQFQQNFGSDTIVSTPNNQNGRTNLLIFDQTYVLYGQANYQLSNVLSAQFGGRAYSLQLARTTLFEPRLSMRWQADDNIAVKLSTGIYYQYLRLASNPDFTFFDTWLPTDSSVKPLRAIHYIASVETKPFENWDLNVDVYYKDLTNINELNQFNTRSDNVANVFFSGKGQAYGAEIFLQKKTGRLTGWVGYALGWVWAQYDSISRGARFNPRYDRRHDFKIVAQYQLSDTWEMGASFTLQSGQPFTGASSRFQTRLPGETAGAGVTIPTGYNALRLPISHQLNINFNYNTTVFGLPARLLIDIYNVYSRRDIWFRYYDTSQDVTKVTDVRLLPIIPTIALEVKF